MGIEPGTMLSHYRLVLQVGEGGMGVVWKAEDTILRRTVAIKALPADRAMDEDRRRMFLEEARLAASVGHSHVVQVYELGREGALDFIVMEYVDGGSLRSLLRGKPLPPERIAELGIQITEGLARAHRAGLLHRDLKPANIMITSEGDAKIVDFGLATLCQGAESTTGSTGSTVPVDLRAEPGMRVGTVPYMSPEQLRGEKLDARSDIFSLGTVLYEMTTGRRPFEGRSQHDVEDRILKSEPTAVHELLPAVSLDLERIIQKCLARRPIDRYQVVDDVAVDLRRLLKDLDSGSSPSYKDLKQKVGTSGKRWILALGVALLVAAVGAGLRTRWFKGTTGTRAAARTILVLPMEVLGQAEGGDIAGRAAAEAIAINLAQTKDLDVLPVPPAAQFPASALGDRVNAARKLGADILLTGSLVRDGKTLRATVTAVDTNRDRLLCGIQLTQADGDLASFASSTTTDLAMKLGLRRPRQYDYFRFVTWTPEMASYPKLSETVLALRNHDVPTGLENTRRLIELFPNVYEAHAMRFLALVNESNVQGTYQSDSACDAELEQLARIDPQAPVVDLFTASDLATRSVTKAMQIYQRLLSRLDITPAFRAHVLRWRAGALASMMDSTEAAFGSIDEAIRLDPANCYNYQYRAGILLNCHRNEEALADARRAVALDPSEATNYGALIGVLQALGRSEEALSVIKTACEVCANQWLWTDYALELQKAGHGQEAMDAAKTAMTYPESVGGMHNLACYRALVGDRATALRYLRRCVELGASAESLTGDKDLDPLRSEPEFKRIVREAELAPKKRENR